MVSKQQLFGRNNNDYINVLKDSKHCVQSEEYYVNNKLQYTVYRPTDVNSIISNMIIMDGQNNILPNNNITADMVLQTHLQHFTKSGMSPDECIFLLDNHDDYKNIQYAKEVNELWEAKDLKKQSTDKDFAIILTFLPTDKNGNNGHWVTTVVHFKEDNTKEYHIFDSQQYNDEVFVKSHHFYKNSEEQKELPIYKLINHDI